ncbi:IclR family transcriptional regulator [Alsobacter sp. SYSU M60028]|uniref:IclR family transcriptional regulator n=1 Tax=Alsobacter ponti TaxID=2962936 RepID=A0ABT1LH24_9HYPH|nr:IclR family transcriptional regulator [Alsobacter ponti]MCP8940391.1 IclR family transcriptional regulator [Alsobacter ponti]
MLKSQERTNGQRRAAAGQGTRERGIDRVVQLLAALHRHGRPVRIGELCALVEAPRSSTYEIVRTLVDAGLLETSPDSSVFFGKTLYFYGMDYLREHDLVSRGRDEVDRLARETGETCQFCMLTRGQYTVVHMRAGVRPFRISSEVGTRIPAPWTASGRLLYSDFGDDEIRALLKPGDLDMPNGQRLGVDEFVASVRQAREEGFCITSGLVDAYTHCLAAPIRDHNHGTVATICFVVPIDTPAQRIAQLRDTLVASGHALSVNPPSSATPARKTARADRADN